MRIFYLGRDIQKGFDPVAVIEYKDREENEASKVFDNLENEGYIPILMTYNADRKTNENWYHMRDHEEYLDFKAAYLKIKRNIQKRRYIVQQHFILGYCIWDLKTRSIVKDNYLEAYKGFSTKSAAQMCADRLEDEDKRKPQNGDERS